ncbi:MAG TPA: ThiF family adenylyltransferase [Candidatus Binataceae bacterium]|nr:ThiF family adenylyltransferase [Candidatus Binataceae bacterium]
MGLNNQQIERYARQIIVPGVGGLAQERLLASRLTLLGSAHDVAPVLAYMAGAGVGRIHLWLTGGDQAAQIELLGQAQNLNRDVVVTASNSIEAPADLVFALAGDSATARLIRSSAIADSGAPLVVAALNEPLSVAVFPRPSPCLRCADIDPPAYSDRRGDNAGFVAMVAATEVFRLLAGLAPDSRPTLLSFEGYRCTARELKQKALAQKCACMAEHENPVTR